jgi:hypothetical protein
MITVFIRPFHSKPLGGMMSVIGIFSTVTHGRLI